MYWGGVRAAGKASVYPEAGEQKLLYRVDLLGVTGREKTGTIGAANTVTAINSRDVSGWAFDASADIPLPQINPLIHLGYAYGSGDNNTTGTDHAFHQTGLQGNYSQIGALSQNTDNYGTVLRPELSNIHIISAGVTTPVLHASDVGVIYRYYRLADTATSIASSGIFNTLDGTHRSLGQGVDLLFNADVMKEAAWNPSHVQSVGFRSSLGFFRSGDAYGAAKGENAVRGLVELKVGF
jgi:alginate production protein